MELGWGVASISSCSQSLGWEQSHRQEVVASTSTKSEVPEGVAATIGPMVKRVARPSPRQPAREDGLNRRASAPLLPSSICHRASPLARRASPTPTSQWLLGDRGVRAGARESPGRPPGWLPPPPEPPSLSVVPGVVATSPLGPPPRWRLGLPVAPCWPHSRKE